MSGKDIWWPDLLPVGIFYCHILFRLCLFIAISTYVNSFLRVLSSSGKQISEPKIWQKCIFLSLIAYFQIFTYAPLDQGGNVATFNPIPYGGVFFTPPKPISIIKVFFALKTCYFIIWLFIKRGYLIFGVKRIWNLGGEPPLRAP